MLNALKNEANLTYTENGAVTLGSTGSYCLDLFASIGALRRQDERDIIDRFIRAYTEDPDIAMKTLFFARDIRGGLGERRVFRTIIKWLAMNETGSVIKNIRYFAEYGRYDDLLTLMDTPCEKEVLEYIEKQLEDDLKSDSEGKSVSLLAKWLPSVNASNCEAVFMAKKIAKAIGMSSAEYRKVLSTLRSRIRIIENNLREKDYTFNYEAQPSRALFKYRAAFMRNDSERYNSFINRVSDGKAKLNASNISPYELVEPYINDRYFTGSERTFMRSISEEEKKVLNATWESFPDYGGEENYLAVIDTSGSMYWDWTGKPLPAAVALSLGLYFAERNKGTFANCFIEFSERPQLVEIKGETFCERLRYVASFNEIANTNIEAVFDLILRASVKNNVPQKELPAKLIIISDMEFDQCIYNADETNFENAKKKYAAYGYKLPDIVFWNVASRNRQQPVKQNEQGVALVSGVTPKLFSMIASGEISPYKMMMDILCSERYRPIAA